MPKFLVLVGTAFLVATFLVRVNADLNLTLSKAKEAASIAAVLAVPEGIFASGEERVLGEATSSPDAGNSDSIQTATSSNTIQSAKITENKSVSIKQSIRDILDRLTQLNTVSIISIQNQLNSNAANKEASSLSSATNLLPGMYGYSWSNDASLSLAQGNITVTQGNITVGSTKLFANGNVGVNTLSPAATLDVNGTLNAGTSTFASLFSNGSSTISNFNFSNSTGTTLNVTNLTVSSCSGCGGVAGGSSGQIQYNNGGVFAGDSSFTWSSSTKLFTLTGTSTISGKVSIGTTTPSGVFNVAGATTTTYLSVTAGGFVGIGTSTPATSLSIQDTTPTITLSKPNSQTYQIRNNGNFEIFDKNNSVTRFLIDLTGQTLVGTSSNIVANGSRMFVWGGASGANIDVMGENAVGRDQAFLELEGSDYGTNFDSTSLRFYGVNALGTTMGFNNFRLGVLDFQAVSTSIIKVSNATPLIFGTNETERMRLTASGTLVIGTTTQVGIFNVASATTTNYFNVNQAGQVGIGTTTPAYRLVVGDRTTQSDIYIPKGGLCVGASTSTCPATPQVGSIYAAATVINAIDLAENYPTQDASLEAGDLVAVDLNNSEYVIKGTADTRDNLLGVVSTHPGVLLGSEVANSKPIALSGRVPVKVGLEGGPIHIGDYLTQSSVPGIAMKQTGPGISIGIALENFDFAPIVTSTDPTISAFMKMGFNLGSGDASSTSLLSRFAQAVKNAISQIKDLVLSTLTANTVITNRLCLGSTCIQEPELQRLLNNSGVSSSPLPPPITTAEPATSTDSGASSTPIVDTTSSTSTPPEPILSSTSTATSTP